MFQPSYKEALINVQECRSPWQDQLIHITPTRQLLLLLCRASRGSKRKTFNDIFTTLLDNLPLLLVFGDVCRADDGLDKVAQSLNHVGHVLSFGEDILQGQVPL